MLPGDLTHTFHSLQNRTIHYSLTSENVSYLVVMRHLNLHSLQNNVSEVVNTDNFIFGGPIHCIT